MDRHLWERMHEEDKFLFMEKIMKKNESQRKTLSSGNSIKNRTHEKEIKRLEDQIITKNHEIESLKNRLEKTQPLLESVNKLSAERGLWIKKLRKSGIKI